MVTIKGIQFNSKQTHLAAGAAGDDVALFNHKLFIMLPERFELDTLTHTGELPSIRPGQLSQIGRHQSDNNNNNNNNSEVGFSHSCSTHTASLDHLWQTAPDRVNGFVCLSVAVQLLRDGINRLSST